MKTVRGGIWRFNPTKMFSVYYEAVLEVCIIAARRAEAEARIMLMERMKDEKSSGTLSESIFGVTDIKPNAIIIALMASAVETGQWESEMGEGEEADRATMSPAFDYAMVVEQGSGIYAEDEYGNDVGQLIEASDEFVFWNGDYTQKGNRSLIRTPYSTGQPALHFMRDAMLIIQPQIDEMLKKVFNKINVEQFLERK